ncbi:UNKNOWN [Stylonychia lemnae]|uniref:Transmembrane protein n=1 Tax=Stylonychia lemnae TaxID=5949 RepID=A0A078AZP3_STYLE|nr:UNKNOWN [Stylonychia lemnae]|eukprot:CDW86672.1 UNKNOWN [Stylonychia lemnae]
MFFRRIQRFIKRLDKHGEPIALNYKGQHQHQTVIGGVITLLQIFGVITFFFILLNRVISKDKNIRIKSVYKSATYNNQQYHIDLNNFDLAFGIKFERNEDENFYAGYDIKRFLNISFISQNITFVQNKTDGTFDTISQEQYIGYENCRNGRFLNKTAETNIIGLNKNGWFCIKELDLTIQGQEMSLLRNLLKLSVSPCQNDSNNSLGSKCASQNQISDFISKIQLMIAFVNSNFEEDIYNQPVKSEVVIQYYNAIEGQAYNAYLNLQKNYLYSYNSWLSYLFDVQTYEYLSVEFIRSIQGTIKPGTWEMFNVLIFCHTEEIVIERFASNLVDIITTLGGFINVLALLTKLIAKVFSKRVLYWQLITDIMHFENYQPKNILNQDIYQILGKDLSKNQSS